MIISFLACKRTVKCLKALAVYITLDAINVSFLFGRDFFIVMYLLEDQTPFYLLKAHTQILDNFWQLKAL